jgi:hypothetical protein
VSLPVATLIVGAEMLGLYSLLVYGLWSPHKFPWSLLFEFFLNLLLVIYFVSSFSLGRAYDLQGLALIAFLIGFWAATFVSGYLLRRTVWREDHRQPALRVARQRLRGLFLLIAFAWALIYLVTYIGTRMIPFGPSSAG